MQNTSLTFFCENKILNAVLRERQAQAAELEVKYDVDIPNRISFIVSFFAVIRTGAVPILALPAHREAELEGIMKVAEPKAYIVAESALNIIQTIGAKSRMLTAFL